MTTENTFKENNSNNTSEDGFSIAEVFFHYMSYWKWYLLSIIVFLTLAYLYIRYADTQYKVVAKVVIKDEKRGQTGTDMTAFQELGIITQVSNLDNEIEILSSKTLMKSVVDSLKLNVSYYKEGRIKKTEIYKQTPVWVRVQTFEKPGFFELDKLDEGRLLISSAKEDFSREVQYGQEVSTPWGLLKLEVNPFGTSTAFPIEVELNDPKILPLAEVLPIGKTSSVVDISLVTSCPDKGIDILNTLVKHYNQNAIDDKNYVATNTMMFIDERLLIISGELQSAERDVEVYRRAQGLTDFQAQAQLALNSSSDYDKQIASREIQLNLLRSIKNFLMAPENIGQIAPANIGLDDQTILNNIQLYNEEVLRKKTMTSGMTASNPVILEFDDRIAVFKDNLLKGISITENSMELALRELRKQESIYVNKALGLTTQERESRELYRHQSIKESLFLYLSQKREETGLSLAGATPNAKVIDAASFEDKAVKPEKDKVYIIAFFLGIVIAVLVIYVLDLFDSKIHTKDDVRKIVKAPFLGQIPFAKVSEPFPAMKTRSSVAEQFRVVESNLDFVTGRRNETQVLSITSSTSGEGKSFFSRNLAMSMATMGKKTLLIDLDLRKSVLRETLDIHPTKGIAMFLSDSSMVEEDIIDKSGQFHKNLDIIPVTVFPPNPAELLTSDRFAELIEKLRAQYDSIVIDTAPVGLVVDAFQINRCVDATIYVTRAEYTYKQFLPDIQELYRSNKLKNLCLVLNASVASRRYGYGYGYYKNNYYTEG